jgi:Dna[CI] antecedent, DciA
LTRGPEPIGEDVKRELARFGPAAGLAEVVAAWPAAVGEAIAANAWPARIARDGTLHVHTSSSAWAFELAQLAEHVRARLAERLEDDPPSSLRFALGPIPEPGAEDVTQPQRTVPTPSQAVRLEAETIAASIADAELRAAAARAVAAGLAAQKGEPSDQRVW